jgi:F-type H+-transporting ATPase subunit delta
VIDPSVARRYARALLSIALDQGDGRDRQEAAERYGAQLSTIAGVLAGSTEVRSALFDPGYTSSQRHQVIATLAQRLQLDEVIGSFLRLLVDRKRISLLPAIARAYGDMVDQLVGRVRATVTAALPLSEAELAAVRDVLARAVQRKIVLEGRTDPALVGGLVAQVGGTVFDGSLRTQLLRLRDELKQQPV